MSSLIHQPMVALLTRLAGGLAIIVAVLPTAAYWLHVRTSSIEQINESLRVQALVLEEFIASHPVSYTHLTLPTSDLV